MKNLNKHATPHNALDEKGQHSRQNSIQIDSTPTYNPGYCGACRGPPTKQPEVIDVEELDHLQIMREFTNSVSSIPSSRVVQEDGCVQSKYDFKQLHEKLVYDGNVVAEVSKFTLKGDEGVDGPAFN